MACWGRHMSIDTVIRRLEHFTILSETEKIQLLRAFRPARTIKPRQEILRQGDRPDHINAVLDGFVARYKTLPDGRSQTTAIYVPGDMFDLRLFLVGEVDHTLESLSIVEVAFLPSSELNALTEAHPQLARAFWWSTLVNEAIMGEWVVNLGCRTAYERLAHFICELRLRLSVVTPEPESMPFPFTQADLAHILGLSAVHVNRVFRQMTRDGLVEKAKKHLRILDFARLADTAKFNGRYLHIR